MQLNGFKYCYVITIIQFSHTVKEFQVLLFNTNFPIDHSSFICTQLNGFKYCNVSLTIQLNISQLFTVLFQTVQFSLSRRINFYLLRTFCPHLGSFFFLCCFFSHYVSAKFHLWPSSGDLPRPRIGMLSLVTISPVITAFHSCCLSHHVFLTK